MADGGVEYLEASLTAAIKAVEDGELLVADQLLRDCLDIVVGFCGPHAKIQNVPWEPPSSEQDSSRKP